MRCIAMGEHKESETKIELWRSTLGEHTLEFFMCLEPATKKPTGERKATVGHQHRARHLHPGLW